MGSGGFVGVEGVARKIKSIYIGVNGVAQEVKNAYVGVEGVAELIYSGRGPGFITLSGDSFNTYVTESTTLNVVTASGAVSVSVSDPAISASISGNVITVTSNNNTAGNYSVTIHVAESEFYSATELIVPAVVSEKQAGYITLDDDFQLCMFGSQTVNVLSASGNITGVSAGTDDISATFTSSSITVSSLKSTHGTFQIIIDVAASNTHAAASVPFDVTVINRLQINFSTSHEATGSAKVGNLALFAGGGGAESFNSTVTVETINSSLVKGSAPDLATAKRNIGAASINNYALFVGGKSQYNHPENGAEAYSSSLVKSVLTSCSLAQKGGFGTYGCSVNNNAIFFSAYGAYGSGTHPKEYVAYDIYNSSFTLSSFSFENVLGSICSATQISDLAFGVTSGNYYSRANLPIQVIALNASLTRTMVTLTDADKYTTRANHVGGYGLFAGGGMTYYAPSGAYSFSDTVEVINNSLTVSLINSLSEAKWRFLSAEANGVALFAGGYSTTSKKSKSVDGYDNSLTRTIYSPLSTELALPYDNFDFSIGIGNHILIGNDMFVEDYNVA